MKGEFADAYFKANKDFAGLSGALASEAYVSDVQSALDSAILALQKEAERRQHVAADYVKGNLAEVWHAETLKVAATAKANDEVWATATHNNRPGQDIAYGDASTTSYAELKYYKTGEDTAKQLGNPAYSDSQKVVPADQLADVVTESQKQAARNQDTRPEVAKAYQHTADTASERIEVDDIASTPLSEGDAKKLATDLKSEGQIDPDAFGLNTESFIEWSDICRESGSAALHAAAFSAALTAAPHVYRMVEKYLRSGQFDTQDLKVGAGQILSNSSAAALRGGIAAAISASCRAGLMGNALKGVSPTAVGLATAMALNSIENSWRYSQGQISGKELAFNSSRDAIALLSGWGGATIGQILIPIPIVGALIGNLVGATLGGAGVTYANSKVLAICVESGWTFWGLVDQSYVVPEEVLRRAGFDLFASLHFQVDEFVVDRFDVRQFQTEEAGFAFLRRGVIAFNTVGYV